jgi:hypothetical protein
MCLAESKRKFAPILFIAKPLALIKNENRMTLKKILIITIISILLISCNNKSLDSNTELYNIKIKKFDNSQKEYKSYIEEGGKLNIKSDRITLRELFSLLMETDEKNIILKNKKLEKEYFNVLIEQKKKEEPVSEIVFNKILENWNLKFTEEKYNSYEIEIKDSIKFYNYQSNLMNDNQAKIMINEDSIKIKNSNLENIAKVFNSQFAEEIVNNIESKRINYSWKKKSFDKTKVEFENDLGLSFRDRKEKKSIFRIENN